MAAPWQAPRCGRVGRLLPAGPEAPGSRRSAPRWRARERAAAAPGLQGRGVPAASRAGQRAAAWKPNRPGCASDEAHGRPSSTSVMRAEASGAVDATRVEAATVARAARVNRDAAHHRAPPAARSSARPPARARRARRRPAAVIGAGSWLAERASQHLAERLDEVVQRGAGPQRDDDLHGQTGLQPGGRRPAPGGSLAAPRAARSPRCGSRARRSSRRSHCRRRAC